ncbi:E3 ubiquitin-protein ligase NHLRC1-like [Daphnia pulex]|uniref:E3 ubiquitin-protein ligase NHLRC1-like n=1 Tax=Daphnia pulex TaxID=6669 RepID=UPI001EDE9B63|nr:E3 ubiquitin-protein ligase NHLRC1-like [Daphnia pulex]
MADSGGGELNEDEFLCCSICFHKYDLQLMRPKVLPCSHTFCFTCLKALHSGNTLKCPVCRHEAVEITDVLTLPNNKYVQHIVHLSEKLRDAQAQIKRVVVILINETVSYDSYTHLDLTLSNYHGSSYCKDYIQEVNAHCGPMKLKLLHVDLFEELGEHRHKYLKAMFKDVRTTDPNANVILSVGGYVENKEVMDAGGLPTRLKCMWEACGKPQKCKLEFTSDVSGLEI